jgi:hypothetical protein
MVSNVKKKFAFHTGLFIIFVKNFFLFGNFKAILSWVLVESNGGVPLQ